MSITLSIVIVQRNHEGAINLESNGPGQQKRFSIDD